MEKEEGSVVEEGDRGRRRWRLRGGGPYLVVRETHVLVGLLELPEQLQLQAPLLHLALLVQTLLILLLLLQTLPLLQTAESTQRV